MHAAVIPTLLAGSVGSRTCVQCRPPFGGRLWGAGFLCVHGYLPLREVGQVSRFSGTSPRLPDPASVSASSVAWAG